MVENDSDSEISKHSMMRDNQDWVAAMDLSEKIEESDLICEETPFKSEATFPCRKSSQFESETDALCEEALIKSKSEIELTEEIEEAALICDGTALKSEANITCYETSRVASETDVLCEEVAIDSKMEIENPNSFCDFESETDPFREVKPQKLRDLGPSADSLSKCNTAIELPFEPTKNESEADLSPAGAVKSDKLPELESEHLSSSDGNRDNRERENTSASPDATVTLCDHNQFQLARKTGVREVTEPEGSPNKVQNFGVIASLSLLTFLSITLAVMFILEKQTNLSLVELQRQSLKDAPLPDAAVMFSATGWRLWTTAAFLKSGCEWHLNNLQLYSNADCTPPSLINVNMGKKSFSRRMDGTTDSLFLIEADAHGDFWIDIVFNIDLTVRCVTFDQPDSSFATEIVILRKQIGEPSWHTVSVAKNLTQGSNFAFTRATSSTSGKFLTANSSRKYKKWRLISKERLKSTNSYSSHSYASHGWDVDKVAFFSSHNCSFHFFLGEISNDQLRVEFVEEHSKIELNFKKEVIIGCLQLHQTTAKYKEEMLIQAKEKDEDEWQNIKFVSNLFRGINFVQLIPATV